MAAEPRYWFPAKRFGWGWGLPSAWQGWVVLVAFVCFVSLSLVFLQAHHTKYEVVRSLWVVGGASAALGLICWWKGEPPKWRWGAKP